MGKLILCLILLLSPLPGLCADDWYVRPADDGEYGTEDGSTYANAFDGMLDIVWGVGGVVAGDTLYVCGTHRTYTDVSWVKHGYLVVGDSGSVGLPITVSFACPTDAGTIDSANSLDGTYGYDPDLAERKQYKVGVGAWVQVGATEIYKKDCYHIPLMIEDTTHLTPRVCADETAVEATLQRGEFSTVGDIALYYRATDGAAPAAHSLYGSVGVSAKYPVEVAGKSYITIVSPKVKNNFNPDQSGGIRIATSDHITVTSPDVQWCQIGMEINESTDISVTDVNILNNYMDGGMIQYECSDITISGGLFQYNGYWKLYGSSASLAYSGDQDGLGIGIGAEKSVVFNGTSNDVTAFYGIVPHEVESNESVVFSIINTTTGISVGTTYYVVQLSPDNLTFKLALTPGGDAIDLIDNGSGYGFFLISGSFNILDVTIDGIQFLDNGPPSTETVLLIGMGIVVSSTYLASSRVNVTNCYFARNHNGGLGMPSGGKLLSGSITGNIFDNACNQDMVVGTYPYALIVNAEETGEDGTILIANNTFVNNQCRASFYISWDAGRTLPVGVKNNIFYNNGYAAETTYFGDMNIPAGALPAFYTSDYNAFYRSGTAWDAKDVLRHDTTGYDIDHMVCGAGCWSTVATRETNSQAKVDPYFVSASDFHLQGKSTMKSLGTNLGTGFTDFAGVSLPTPYGWPIGAYGYNSFGGGTGSFSGSIQ